MNLKEEVLLKMNEIDIVDAFFEDCTTSNAELQHIIDTEVVNAPPKPPVIYDSEYDPDYDI